MSKKLIVTEAKMLSDSLIVPYNNRGIIYNGENVPTLIRKTGNPRINDSYEEGDTSMSISTNGSSYMYGVESDVIIIVDDHDVGEDRVFGELLPYEEVKIGDYIPIVLPNSIDGRNIWCKVDKKRPTHRKLNCELGNNYIEIDFYKQELDIVVLRDLSILEEKRNNILTIDLKG